jgi:hypothetical protein
LYPKQARYQATLRPDPEPEKLPGILLNCNSGILAYFPALRRALAADLLEIPVGNSFQPFAAFTMG